MASITWKSIALKWSMLLILGSVIPFEEFSPLYMKQLGLKPSQIGLTWFFGIPSFSVIVFGFLADNFRARKLMFVISVVLLGLLTLTMLLPLTVQTLTSCVINIGNYSNARTPVTNADKNLTLKYFNSTTQVTMPTNRTVTTQYHNVASKSIWLFLFLVIIKVAYEMTKRLALTLANVAVLTYVEKESEKGSLGSYIFWGHIGSGVTVFVVGMIASHSVILICGKYVPSYFAVFPMTAVMAFLTITAVPWLDYEYLEDRVINWADVKSVVFDVHYIVMFFISFYGGCCLALLYFWDNWYIDFLHGGPNLLTYSEIARRSYFATWYIISGKIMEKIGDIKMVVVALVLCSTAQLSYSFIYNAWFVLIVDIFQTSGTVLLYVALNVHFFRAGSKASSAFIMGKMESDIVTPTASYMPIE